MNIIPLRPGQLDVNGRWRVIHRVERSALSRYVGLEIEFDVILAQEGDRVTGTGEKFMIGFELAGRREASTLTLDGRRDGNMLRLALVETPPGQPDREIQGEIAWTIATEDMLTGSFRVDVADSAGTSRALRR